MKNVILSEEYLESKIPVFFNEFTKMEVAECYPIELLTSSIYSKYLAYYLLFKWQPQLVTSDIPTIYYNQFYWFLIYRILYNYAEGDDSELIDEFLEIQNTIPKEIDINDKRDIEYYEKAHIDATAIIEKLHANNPTKASVK